VTEVEYELMTIAEILEAKRKAPIAFAPISPIEWHGPHMPVGTDGLHAHHVAVRVAGEVGGVVLPTFFLGTETVRLPGSGAEQLGALGLADDTRVVGMDLPGFPVRSLYLEEGAFAVAVRELVRALAADDFRLVVLVNGHGARNHMRALERIAREETRTGELTVMSLMVWVRPTPPNEDPGHATLEETAVMMAVARDRVHLDRLPPVDAPLRYADYGIVDGRAFDGFPSHDFTVPPEADPRSASVALGEQILDREVKAAVAQIQEEVERW
jgi:creatinine amidohydrolase